MGHRRPLPALPIVTIALWVMLLQSCGRSSSSPGVPQIPTGWQDTVDAPSKEPADHMDALAALGLEAGNRAAGTIGYAQSVDYVIASLPAGFTVTRQSFSYTTTKTRLVPASTSPSASSAPLGQPGQWLWPSHPPAIAKGAGAAEQIAHGIVIAKAPATHLYPGLPHHKAIFDQGKTRAQPATGCHRDHYPIRALANQGRAAVMVAPGGCPLATKARVAQSAGAAWLITLGRSHHACIGHPESHQTPTARVARVGLTIVGVDPKAWSQLLSRAGPEPLALRTYQAEVVTENIIATWRAASDSTNETKVFAIGAHLDSVSAGAGVNDNGSGVSVLLSLAQTVAAETPAFAKDLTLMFWGGEEDGLKGSRYYVDQLPSAARDRIAGYLNLDMVGSPNYGRFIYGSRDEAKQATRTALKGFYGQNDLSTETVVVGARSDHYPFQVAGIEVAGLFTGGIELKSASQQQVFGGVGGQSYDGCYHLACDNGSNYSGAALRESYRATAYTTAIMAGRSPTAD